MAYTRQARASALRIVAAQGYHIAAALTGISETSLRRWAQDQAEQAMRGVKAEADATLVKSLRFRKDGSIHIDTSPAIVELYHPE